MEVYSQIVPSQKKSSLFYLAQSTGHLLTARAPVEESRPPLSEPSLSLQQGLRSSLASLEC